MTTYPASNIAATQAPSTHHTLEQHAEAFDLLEASGAGIAQVAKTLGLPRTTLQHWVTLRHAIDQEPALVSFLTSSCGLAFLHRLTISVHLVFGLMGSASARLMSRFFELTGLSVFVASSKTVCNDLQRQATELTRTFAQEERERLNTALCADLGGATRSITLACDETFHRQRVCLVAIEPLSGFICTEAYVSDRKLSTWILAARRGLRGLPFTVVQLVADGGTSLEALSTHFQAPLSPDLFHLLHPLVEQVLRPATRYVKELQEKKKMSSDELAAAQRQVESLRLALRELNVAYHPLDLARGKWQPPHRALRRLRDALETLAEVIQKLDLGARAAAALASFQKHLPALEAVLHRAQKQRLACLAALPPVERLQVDALARSASLCRVARSARAAERKRLRILAEDIEQAIVTQTRPEHGLMAQEIVSFFERSTSCVEGRNGYLELWHHAHHRLSQARLEALTAIHNFVIQRDDGTTAAERLFGHKSLDLFSFLLERMAPPRPPSGRLGSHRTAHA